MMLQRRISARRTGATTVEFAIISLLLFTMLFAIFEYGRFLFTYHTAYNAARDAVRFAVVHTGGGTMAGEPATITATDVQTVCTTGMFNGQMYGTGMCGVEGAIDGYAVNVFGVTDANYYANPPVINPTGAPAWNSASFQQKICVQVTGTYRPVVPNLIGLNANIPFTISVFGGSEAN